MCIAGFVLQAHCQERVGRFNAQEADIETMFSLERNAARLDVWAVQADSFNGGFPECKLKLGIGSLSCC